MPEDSAHRQPNEPTQRQVFAWAAQLFEVELPNQPHTPISLSRFLADHDPSFSQPQVLDLLEAVGDLVAADRIGMLRALQIRMSAGRRVACLRPGLHFGSAFAAKHFDLLQARSVSHAINCTGASLPNFHEPRIHYLRLCLDDSPNQPIVEAVGKTCAFIDGCLSTGGAVYVHCHRGVSRSAAMVIGYLMVAEGLSYETALAEAQRVRPAAQPNSGFGAQLASLAPNSSAFDTRVLLAEK